METLVRQRGRRKAQTNTTEQSRLNAQLEVKIFEVIERYQITSVSQLAGLIGQSVADITGHVNWLKHNGWIINCHSVWSIGRGE